MVYSYTIWIAPYIMAKRSPVQSEENSEHDSFAAALNLGNYVRDACKNMWFFLKQLMSLGKTEWKCNHGKHNFYIMMPEYWFNLKIPILI